MILVDLDSLYKAEDTEEIHFNKYFAFRMYCLLNYRTMTIYILSMSHCKSPLTPPPPPPPPQEYFIVSGRVLFCWWKLVIVRNGWKQRRGIATIT